jgi:hypothetical protein
MDNSIYLIFAASLVFVSAIAWSCARMGSESDKRMGMK